MKSTDVIGRSAHALLSLPNAVHAPLAGPRPTIDGQRLTPPLQLLANGGKRALAGRSFPPTALERRFDAVGQWLTLAHGDDASWRDLSAGGRRARLFEPMEPTTGLVVFVHGGGWQFGSIDASHGVCAFLSKTTGLKVLSLDYRLAWQAQFPAAFDDVVAGFREAVDRADELGVARNRIAIAGDSAGGNIASAAALALGADPTYRPKLAALIYPVVDGDLDRYESTHLFHAPLDRAIVHRDMPFSRILRALVGAASSTFRGRPPLRPLAAAAARPARVRSIMVSRSSCAKAAMMVSIALPIAPSV
ncbi:MAG: acetyl esterase [Mycobacterium sp.]|jgi:acetyl esterase|nr:acetyl esterase [Mycobacterium sp.]